MSPGVEAALVAAAQSGSSEAFARLLESNQQAVRGFLRRLGGGHADADDLAQDAFLTAWSRIGAFRRGESFRAWVCGVAYRKWLAHRRSEGRRAAREAAVASGDTDDAPAAAVGARLDAAAALAHLPDQQRAAVVLCLAADFSHAEAAEALGLPLGTVKSHVTRGRAKLLELLGGSDERS